ncbi:auxin-responsive protein SAUR40 [Henckelia pumila]|uniref:auxin-responsive protein SAUR40 n=1 Tax=Henckelia pumila TaxID=405737 RepID=UPI003C6DC196
MEFEAETKKKSNSLFKKLESYMSMNRRSKSSSSSSSSSSAATSMFSKSRSWHGSKTGRVSIPNGCFSVYVGPEKQRFVIETKCLNHSLFRMLLEDAETEYGFNCDGPLLLPCEVDLFCKVLAEMKCTTSTDHDYTYASCSPFVNPARRLGKSDMAKGYSSYGLLTPPRWLKINHF